MPEPLVIEMSDVPARTLMDKAFLLEVELAPSPMVAVTVKVAICGVAAVGVPLIVPSLLKVSPAGRDEPVITDHDTVVPSATTASS